MALTGKKCSVVTKIHYKYNERNIECRFVYISGKTVPVFISMLQKEKVADIYRIVYN